MLVATERPSLLEGVGDGEKTVTRFMRREVTCKACGAQITHSFLLSTNSFGADPDLDFRPGGMARTALLQEVNECDACGYCAPNISRGPDSVADILDSEPYRRAVADLAGPDLARSWRCWALLSEIAGDRAEAGRANLSAAWASDSAGQEDAARAYRAIVLENLSECADAGLLVAQDAESQQLLELDLQRQLGHYTEATRLADAVISSPANDEMREVAQFHAAMIEREDNGRYTFGDARQYAESPEDWLRRGEESDSKRWWQFWR